MLTPEGRVVARECLKRSGLAEASPEINGVEVSNSEEEMITLSEKALSCSDKQEPPEITGFSAHEKNHHFPPESIERVCCSLINVCTLFPAVLLVIIVVDIIQQLDT